SLLQTNINELLTSIKTVISSSPSQSNVQSEQIYKLLNQLENSIKPNSPLLSEKALQFNPELQKTNINNDIKSMLLQLKEELSQNQSPSQSHSEAIKNVDKLLTQVDYYQLMSLTSTSNYIYFPFIWDMLEDGSLSMKKLNDERFFVEINLKLKEYGKVDMLLIMYDENHLDISIFAQKQNLKNEFKEHLQNLKQSLSSVGIVPGTIKLLDLKEENEKTKEEDSFTDVYEYQTEFGINIKV
ncbi:MAG: flagellar hook-length control protein FliK, partial [Campylobacteraceae bacterium]|nr:flagellar hook-length control protein FliK [Campylobacteraceae bacterium]